MAQHWYYRLDNKVYGPVSADSFRRLAAEGKLSEETPVRLGESGKWVKAQCVKGLKFVETEPEPDMTFWYRNGPHVVAITVWGIAALLCACGIDARTGKNSLGEG